MLLRDKDRKTLVDLFSSVEVPIEVWAYGSRVSRTAHDGSDLDLAIRSKNLQKLPPDVLSEIKRRVRESNIPIVVELFDWARLPETFHCNIKAHYEVLFSSGEMTANEPPSEYRIKEK